MRLSYTLTLADYKAAQRLHIRQKISRQINFYLWFVLTPVFAIAGLTMFAFLPVFKLTRFAPQLFGAECALMWLAVYHPAWRAYSIRKCFKRIFPPVATDRNISVEINDDQVISMVPGVSEGKFFWNAILAFAQDEKISLLYIRKTAFLFIPTYAMSPDERTELNDLVARHVVKR